MKRLFYIHNKRPIIDLLNCLYGDNIGYNAEITYLNKESVDEAVNREAFLLSRECDMFIKVFYKDFLDKNMEPSVSIDDRDLPVLADEGALRRVFSNLIQNILSYGKQFTSITLKQQDGYVSAVFENDAPGLSEEDTTHIFERFFTADRTRNGKGTGLGLAITKQLVEQMGHSITARLKDGNLSIEIRWKNQ